MAHFTSGWADRWTGRGTRGLRTRRLRFEPLEPRRVLAPLYQPVGGDYNVDSSVDAADYVVWRKSLDQSVEPYSGADGSGHGFVGPADRDIWQTSFGYGGPPRPNIGFASFAAVSGTQLVLEIVGSDLGDTITVSASTFPSDILTSYQNAAC